MAIVGRAADFSSGRSKLGRVIFLQNELTFCSRCNSAALVSFHMSPSNMATHHVYFYPIQVVSLCFSLLKAPFMLGSREGSLRFLHVLASFPNVSIRSGCKIVQISKSFQKIEVKKL